MCTCDATQTPPMCLCQGSDIDHPCRFAPNQRGNAVAKQKTDENDHKISRDDLAKLLNEDLAREYQAIISYVVYSQVRKGAEFMIISEPLGRHAQQQLNLA